MKPKFHVEYWSGREWIRISGAKGLDSLKAAEMQKKARAKSWKTTEENFSVVCALEPV